MKNIAKRLFLIWSLLNEFWNKLCSRAFVTSIINAGVLLIISYLFSHLSLPFSDTEYMTVNIYEWGKTKLNIQEKNNWKDSVFLINTCYDLDTIPYFWYTPNHTRYTRPRGYRAITNRMDLYKILKAFSRDTTSYRYILYDIKLDSLPRGHSAHLDTLAMYTDSLVDLIASMPRICIAQSREFVLASEKLSSKAGIVDYAITPSITNFLKYQLIQDSMPSMPLKMYSELYEGSIKKYSWGLYYKDGRTLCLKSIIPTFPFRYKTAEFGWERKEDVIEYFRQTDHMNLHDFRKRFADSDNVAEKGRNKIVVIGDLFEHDIHMTYVGRLSGAVINLNTAINLIQGHHKTKLFFVICLFLFYVGMFYMVIYGQIWWYKLTYKKRFWQSDVTKFILSFIGWIVIFQVVAIVIYACFGIFYNMWVPVIWFTLLSRIYKFLIHTKI